MDLDEVAEMAKKVDAEHEGLLNAKDAKDVAEDELLELLVMAMKPALPAMSTPVVGCAGPIARAVRVDEASSLFLGEQGDWFRIVGSNPPKPYVLNAGEVLSLLDIGTVVATLLAALHGQNGSRVKVTKQIEEETARLAAIGTLLKPSPRTVCSTDEVERLNAIATLLRTTPVLETARPFKRDNHR